MRITVAKTAGFCSGVKRAIHIALDAAKKNHTIEMLGDIVHNETVVQTIQRNGIKKIDRLKNGQGKILLIRAHGASQKTFIDAQKCGYTILDATCPMVKEIHTIARDMERKGYALIVIGDKNHDEVKGILGQVRQKAYVLDPNTVRISGNFKEIRKAAVVVQSTQNIDVVESLLSRLRKVIPTVRFCNTICAPTRLKQKEVHAMPLRHDCILVIGSKTSANTKRLYEISHALNPRTHWVQEPKGLHDHWFKECKTVGITAGASTPAETIRDIVVWLIKTFPGSACTD